MLWKEAHPPPSGPCLRSTTGSVSYQGKGSYVYVSSCMFTLWLFKHAKWIYDPHMEHFSHNIHTAKQCRLVQTRAHTPTFQSSSNSWVFVFRCGVNRLLLVDSHIKRFHKGRIWRNAPRITDSTCLSSVCWSLPAVEGSGSASSAASRLTFRFMWECGHVCECCEVWDSNIYLHLV